MLPIYKFFRWSDQIKQIRVEVVTACLTVFMLYLEKY
jgi:hypothetical protein